MNELGEYLRSIRNKKKLSLKKVCELTSITDSRLSRFENGKISEPPAKELMQLANIYKIDTIDLYLKAGYLFDKDINPQHTFTNVDKLTEKEKEYIQYTINFLLANRKDIEYDI